tara:strand:+ start:419 stop:1333 length:915 start_codon:yes stop_codon:yes gene_type:complete
MDPNKKFLYLNADGAAVSGPTEVSATTVPVSTSAGMEVTSASNFKMYFKESVETDTLDVVMSRTADSDPREIMESIVNQINYSKEPTIVLGDNSTGEYADHRLSNVSLNFAEHTKIILNLPIASRAITQSATDPGAGFSTLAYTANTGLVGQINGEITTSIFIDLEARGISSGTTANDALGIATNSNPAFFTSVSYGVNGIVYAGELICVEAPTGGDTSIGIAANTADVAPDANAVTGGGGHTLVTPATQTRGLRTAFTMPAGGIQLDKLYLIQGGNTDDAYTAGKFIIRLFGAPQNHLNSAPA